VIFNYTTICVVDVNDHLLHSDGDMSRCFIDKEQKTKIMFRYRWGPKIPSWYSPGPKVNEWSSCS